MTKAKRIMIAGALALGVLGTTLGTTQLADATPNGLGDCLELVDVVGNHSTKCGPLRVGWFMGYGDPGDGGIDDLVPLCDGEVIWYGNDDDSFWCEPSQPVYVSAVTVTRDVVNVELGTATVKQGEALRVSAANEVVANPIELLPRFTG